MSKFDLRTMNDKRSQCGVTLTEMVTVVAIVSLLVVLGLPAVRTLYHSFESVSGTRAMIGSALASARAIAAQQQRYAGIRFQKAYDGADPNNAPQYIIFIVHDFEATGLAPGFRAVPGIKPIKLPDSVGVMDLMVRSNRTPTDAGAEDPSDGPIGLPDLANPVSLDDTSAFSIVFSPAGRLVLHEVRTRNRDGDFRPLTLADSADDVFNSPENIVNNTCGMFVQDDYAELGFGAQLSRTNFVIYDRELFDKINVVQRADYIVRLDLERIYINPYMGTMISANQ